MKITLKEFKQVIQSVLLQEFNKRYQQVREWHVDGVWNKVPGLHDTWARNYFANEHKLDDLIGLSAWQTCEKLIKEHNAIWHWGGSFTTNVWNNQTLNIIQRHIDELSWSFDKTVTLRTLESVEPIETDVGTLMSAHSMRDIIANARSSWVE